MQTQNSSDKPTFTPTAPSPESWWQTLLGGLILCTGLLTLWWLL